MPDQMTIGPSVHVASQLAVGVMASQVTQPRHEMAYTCPPSPLRAHLTLAALPNAAFWARKLTTETVNSWGLLSLSRAARGDSCDPGLVLWVLHEGGVFR
jgi:hypothetical protein